ncbi:sigma-70 family RNA polymerase sigma factor [Tundrisphaera lichenicola]|uniref:sigma-70 family RNA polymerase sigma factor n=1 Tax=Tundrisphaera lichenicola TaxID=2029860 RepID=UPI003EBB9FF4
MASAGLGSAYRHLRSLFGAGSVVGLGDGQLLARYSGSKDELAFEALIGRHGPLVLTTCRAVLKSEHDVEDAFQATFLVLARKAGSVQGVESLGGWLHRVAYRASLQLAREESRRRRKEAEASAMTFPVASHPGPDPEWKPILHEEIDRLPKSQRLPVVLCDLESLTYQQAADQLGWTVPTLRCRLARGRQKLRDRLSRRGITASAVVALMAGSSASGSIVPALLVRSTVAAGTRGVTSAGVLALTQIILRGMLMTKIQMGTTALLAALGLATAGVVASGAGRPDEHRPAMKPGTSPSPPAIAKADLPEGQKPGEMVEFRGVVVSPGGKLVANATIRWSRNFFWNDPEHREPEAMSGPDGRFAISAPREKYDQLASERWPIWMVASAPGFGFGWIAPGPRHDPSSELTLRLATDDLPIEGRLLDLEGRPVAGATIRPYEVNVPLGGDLTPWIAGFQDQEKPLDQGMDGGIQLKWPSVTTDPDGRFRLEGFGRERMVRFVITGPNVETAIGYAMTKAVPSIRVKNINLIGPDPLVLNGASFDLAVAPCKPIVGVVRDQDSGEPLAGVEVKGMVYLERDRAFSPFNKVVTDDQGRYRLVGLPTSERYRMLASPGEGLPYLPREVIEAADTPGMDPATIDIRLRKRSLIRGRLIDKQTGQPVSGFVEYHAFRDNPMLKQDQGLRDMETPLVWTQAGGKFSIAALPGRGVLAARASFDFEYRMGIGAERIEGYPRDNTSFSTLTNFVFPGSYHSMVEVNVDSEAESTEVDLQLDPGRTLEVTAVDPEGRPIGGTNARGISDMFSSLGYPEESSTFTIYALDPSSPRRLTITHEGRKLIGSVYLKGDEAGPLTIPLAPWGTMIGRVLDDEGNPSKYRGLESPFMTRHRSPEEAGDLPAPTHVGIPIGKDGRFRIEGLVPGLKYSAIVRNPENGMWGDVFQDSIVGSGEVKDLGDLKVQAPEKKQE